VPKKQQFKTWQNYTGCFRYGWF